VEDTAVHSDYEPSSESSDGTWIMYIFIY